LPVVASAHVIPPSSSPAQGKLCRGAEATPAQAVDTHTAGGYLPASFANWGIV
jgi:hypothetical protein